MESHLIRMMIHILVVGNVSLWFVWDMGRRGCRSDTMLWVMSRGGSNLRSTLMTGCVGVWAILWAPQCGGGRAGTHLLHASLNCSVSCSSSWLIMGPIFLAMVFLVENTVFLTYLLHLCQTGQTLAMSMMSSSIEGELEVEGEMEGTGDTFLIWWEVEGGGGE